MKLAGPLLAVLLLSFRGFAQLPDRSATLRLTQELRTAVQNDSFNASVDLVTRLDESVRALHRASLVRDSRERVAEVLSWLPADTESLWVNQEPFTIVSGEPAQLAFTHPAQEYSIDRLRALDGGTFYRALSNRTVRIVISATRGTERPQDGSSSVPRAMPLQDVVYFYFVADSGELPPAGEMVQGRAAWRASGKEETNWLALLRTDVLVLVNSKVLLGEILQRMSNPTGTRALPAELPEWAQVDQTASFWGLRHFTARAKPLPEDRGCQTTQLPHPDCTAVGATVQYGNAQQRLDVRYLSDNNPAPPDFYGNDVRREFRVEKIGPAVWNLVSDIGKRGPWPMHFAFVLLGFGTYR